MSVQREQDEPTNEIEQELALALMKHRGFCRYLEWRLPRKFSSLISLPTESDILQESFLAGKRSLKEFYEARDRDAWLRTLIHRVHTSMCKKAFTRHGLMEREFGVKDD